MKQKQIRIDVFKWPSGAITVQTDDGQDMGHGTRIAGPTLVLSEARCIAQFWLDRQALRQMIGELRAQTPTEKVLIMNKPLLRFTAAATAEQHAKIESAKDKTRLYVYESPDMQRPHEPFVVDNDGFVRSWERLISVWQSGRLVKS